MMQEVVHISIPKYEDGSVDFYKLSEIFLGLTLPIKDKPEIRVVVFIKTMCGLFEETLNNKEIPNILMLYNCGDLLFTTQQEIESG